ncbi:Tetraacyldisaccharide 4'-kinase [compost metagenome]|jgi:tetraacyldisaccharide 4'-kinase|uniref:Tetraacyldisaccharide 4'-kinase n=2 Tax=Agrobacterium tumefaciens complex TaxID=1183400 RepID=A0ABD5LFL6_AGRRD|nr:MULTISPECIES: tetraacyldisaccharide 4'-kinase [Agrobacterium tumefaciens complex]MCP2135606.1 tetraacyldisaccharide 4'-kinase [Rhizobium sp. SLBN-94]TGE82044.1 tetraacyldisaccharide 4'-kinase [Rhizobium sp. SEMIA 439]EPR19203.1 tetraacyldisaccharide 4'-kinase [Agrobacterium radiobacter DSM 30147]KAA1236181.1 tetraacyldisaccharide 4'-kinase [Agrobacterium tumefaciens]KAB0458687.1 tetraacyldisaccharide 4'-kinase [Agrobacterium tumefaciens]
MVSEAPPFWWQKAGWQAWLLSPFSLLYGKVAGRRMRTAKRASVPVPVICIGNFTVGGAGKTPTAMAIARAAVAKGLKPGFLSRGYGGTLDVTTLVDPGQHRSADVGDEPLLLAREAITVISRKRVEGAHRLVKEGVDLIIMDDGFQSARLTLDYALVVIDTMRGIGNGHLVPGGPVRAPLAEQMRHMTGLLKVGKGHAADALVRQAAKAAKPVFVAAITPQEPQDFRGRRVLAYAGIADPAKFFRTVEALGGEIVLQRSFPDHHHFSDDEIADLLQDAGKQNLQLVTTAKDAVRLNGHHGRAEELLWNSLVIEIDMMFDDPNAATTIIETAVGNCRARLLRENARTSL